jgi:N6-L-threonylcarbamoyladenine synthase
MIILGIETSCDETALSLIDADSQTRIDADEGIVIRVLADKTLSQAELHKQYGGVFPSIAKREHSRNLIPLLEIVLKEAFNQRGNLQENKHVYLSYDRRINTHGMERNDVSEIFAREPELLRDFLKFIPSIKKPRIDAIAVTYGPGLEPCLWTGVNFAKALSLVWNIPVVPVNHMEGHIFSSLLRRKDEGSIINYQLSKPNFSALALLVSGGHTELVLIKKQFDYEIIGRTRDDAVGEAFDKVARLLGLPYPGGPEISRLAEEARSVEARIQLWKPGFYEKVAQLPRPMLHSKDFDFSFSGLKTAVLYLLKRIGVPDEKTKAAIAREFEDAVAEVLIAKTKKAIELHGARMLLIGGGVIANTHIRRAFERLVAEMSVPLFIPEGNLTTDNALMIAAAGFLRFTLRDGSTEPQIEKIMAKGNLRLDKK